LQLLTRASGGVECDEALSRSSRREMQNGYHR
jgi:hypothetical protein